VSAANCHGFRKTTLVGSEVSDVPDLLAVDSSPSSPSAFTRGATAGCCKQCILASLASGVNAVVHNRVHPTRLWGTEHRCGKEENLKYKEKSIVVYCNAVCHKDRLSMITICIFQNSVILE
jgi:hypothetical protein